jgi:hypothetical protein
MPSSSSCSYIDSRKAGCLAYLLNGIIGAFSLTGETSSMFSPLMIDDSGVIISSLSLKDFIAINNS